MRISAPTASASGMQRRFTRTMATILPLCNGSCSTAAQPPHSGTSASNHSALNKLYKIMHSCYKRRAWDFLPMPVNSLVGEFDVCPVGCRQLTVFVVADYNNCSIRLEAYRIKTTSINCYYIFPARNIALTTVV